MKISDIIATIALIISVTSIFVNIFPKRKHLICKYFFFWRHHPENNMKYEYCLTSIIENRSELPISIVSINIKVNGSFIRNTPEKIFLHGGGYPTVNNEHESIKVFTDVFPIDIGPLTSKTVRTYFTLLDETNYDEIESIVFETTRGLFTFKKPKISKKSY